MTNDNTNSEAGKFFTSDELKLIEKTRKYRIGILDAMTNNGKEMPTDTRIARVVNELSTSLDKQITDMATIRAKENENNANDNLAAMTASILGMLDEGAKKVTNRDIELKESFIPTDIVPGEGDITAKPLTMEEFKDEEN